MSREMSDLRAGWDQYPWIGVLPPNRPDQENLAHLVEVCSGLISRRRACVLGSTPEYRDVLAAMFDEVVVIDLSASFYSQVSWMCAAADTEKFVEGDWLSVLPNFEGEFDLICSHFTHGNIAYAQRNEFFSKVSSALVPGGVFFDTIFMPAKELHSPEYIIERYLDAPINLRTLNDFNCEAIFCGAYIHDEGRVSPRLAINTLRKFGLTGHLIKIIDGTTTYVTPENMSWDYCPGRLPDDFGYSAVFRSVQRIDMITPSAFNGHAYLAVSAI